MENTAHQWRPKTQSKFFEACVIFRNMLRRNGFAYSMLMVCGVDVQWFGSEKCTLATHQFVEKTLLRWYRIMFKYFDASSWKMNNEDIMKRKLIQGLKQLLGTQNQSDTIRGYADQSFDTAKAREKLHVRYFTVASTKVDCIFGPSNTREVRGFTLWEMHNFVWHPKSVESWPRLSTCELETKRAKSQQSECGQGLCAVRNAKKFVWRAKPVGGCCHSSCTTLQHNSQKYKKLWDVVFLTI